MVAGALVLAGVVVVCPLEKAAGWLTCFFSSMRTVSLPWLMAAGDRCY